MRRNLPAMALTALLGLAMTWSPARADFSLDAGAEPAERIETLAVHINVGDEGDDLAEPVALDLGLGFPFWLHPVGREESEPASFGAIPRETTATGGVPAGTSATFTYSVDAEAGQDALQATSQLLAGVQVSDIARIGFAGRGASGWRLAGYRIEINGRLFASNDAVDLAPREAQESARFELAELGMTIAPLEAERAEIRSLEEAELAGEADLERLTAVEVELVPLVSRRQWLAGQVEGRHPWFSESSFHSPWREEASIASAKVTLVTPTHLGADTQNRVYFRTGGHKYLLNAEGDPITGLSPSQEFELDLLAGPLTAADVRGHAVGMLAHANPFAAAPDRWHPQRMLVELDGRVVYDSDASPIDHDSLEAIRVIPPAHVGEDGHVVVNVPTARETFVWVAGQGMGLDLVEGGALPLPAVDDPAFPELEPGLVDVGSNPDLAGDFDPGFIPAGADFPPGFGPFPGEAGGWYDPMGMWPGAGWPDPGWPGDGWLDPIWPGAGWPDPHWPGGDPGWGPGGLFLDLLVSWLLPDLAPLDPGEDPPPIGEPVQVEDVRIVEGWRRDHEFTVEWSVSGDESVVDHYQVSLVAVDPTQNLPFLETLATDTVPAGVYTFTSLLTGIVPPAGTFIAPAVVAVPTAESGELPSPPAIGPARPLFLAGTSAFGQLQLPAGYLYRPAGAIFPFMGLLSHGGEPAGIDRAVWTVGQGESQNAILFDDATPGWNLGVRSVDGDRTTIRFELPLFTGRRRVMAHVGYLHGAGGTAEVDVEMRCQLQPTAPGPPFHNYATVSTGPLASTPAGPPEPMRVLEQVVDRADAAWAGGCKLVVYLHVNSDTDDPAHPVGLFGIRVVPEP